MKNNNRDNNRNNSNHNWKRRNSDKQGNNNNNNSRRQRNNQDYQHRGNRNRSGRVVNETPAAQQEPVTGQAPEGQQVQPNIQSEIAIEDLKKCTLCNKVITEMGTAIKNTNTDEYIHFDCAVKDIREKEKPYPNERICYLGKGSFGIIKFLSYSSSPIKFLIKKRIQYEGSE